MGIRTHMLTASLLLALASGSLQGQGLSQQESRLLQQELKFAQKTAQDRERRDELRVKIQPSVDQIGIALSRTEYRDQLVGAYLNSLGQSMVPSEVDASVSFSFRVLHDIRPSAMALPDGRIFVTTGLLALVENEAQLAAVLGHEIAHVTEEHALEHFSRSQSGERRNRIIGVATGGALGGILGGKKGGGFRSSSGECQRCVDRVRNRIRCQCCDTGQVQPRAGEGSRLDRMRTRHGARLRP